jgi:predicted neuraminidase
MARRILLALIVVAAAAAMMRVAGRPGATAFRAPPQTAAAADGAAPRFDTRFVSLRPNIQSHAASLIELHDGRLRAFWYAGSREGAEDVSIRSAVFDPARSEWGAEQLVADRAGTAAALSRYVKKLGNPVPARAADGSLWLYFVTVSVGGWAGSSITAMRSTDEGAGWDPPRRLVTSPFLNVSTLVKGTPFLYADGSLGLPAYHEFIDKFGELLRFDGEGRLTDKQRLSSGRYSLQPVLMARSATQALVLMRNSGSAAAHRVIATASDDGGRHWSEAAPTALANPDAAVSGVVLPDGRLLVALNNVEDNRDSLSLVISSDGGASWNTVYQLEQQADPHPDEARYGDLVARLAAASDARIADGRPYADSIRRQMCEGGGADKCGFEFSYPYLMQTRAGDFDLVYTWNRGYIKHVRFNRAWLAQRLAESVHAPH